MNREEPSRPTYTVRELSSGELLGLYDLRLRVLRPGRPAEAAFFAGDDLPTTIHLGAFDAADRLVGIATLLSNEGMQLRGMATDPSVRGHGAGAAILRTAHRMAAERGDNLWCNARLSAVSFYEKMGWRVVGDEFQVAEVGPHRVMRYAPDSA